MKKIINIIIASLFLFVPLLIAQRPRMQAIESPQVHADRTVTFNFKAPQANQVELSTQFIKGPQALTKDSTGLWTITLGPVEPDIYPYNFIVDGISVADPNNVNIFPNERFKSSLVEIPADKPAIYSLQNVPHGQMTYCYYFSKSMQVTRPLIVYTPPGYNKNNQKYPVFYLISGTTDTEETWFKVGRANVILDNLIAQNKAVPMLIVMPYGNTFTGTPDPSSLQAADMYKIFNDDLVGSIIPYVEENFRAIPKRESRAIAGFSRGGGQSLFAGFTNIDKFAWICSYSAYLSPEVFEKYFSNIYSDPQATNNRLKLLWLGVGNEDFLYKQAITFNELLKEKHIEQQNLITSGGHTWMNARLYLTETLQLFFK
ncbi:MAG TPA: alpha/beta hydrolase-fold protein [bacterium]|nr:alpha/beta hydrolase-fold protein [bacterium]HPN42030.1 alpha/beta hydrolase-fold protein [bacterium]